MPTFQKEPTVWASQREGDRAFGCMTPEGLEPPALGFGILRAAIAPWRREPHQAGREHSWVFLFSNEKKKIQNFI